jgi:A/G-specific adenine glycosylase
MKLSSHEKTAFQQTIWSFYRQQGRTFAWRNAPNPYCVVVSEIMLQQTQTYRVAPKYEQFIITFPTFAALAAAPLRDVLSVWQGLGYNRRGKALHEIAQKVVDEYAGLLPNNPTILETFPGIGAATAGSICAFAFNVPTVFIETNIRTVYLHFFFQGQDDVHDKQLLPLIEQTLDTSNPREWYYALMDYGVYLKKLHANPSRRSAHHTKQSKFEGSDRQIRGMIIKLLTERQHLKVSQIIAATGKEAERVHKALEQLCAEGLVVKYGEQYQI